MSESTHEPFAHVRGLSGVWHAAPLLAGGKPALVAYCGYQPLARGWRQVTGVNALVANECRSCRKSIEKREAKS